MCIKTQTKSIYMIHTPSSSVCDVKVIKVKAIQELKKDLSNNPHFFLLTSLVIHTQKDGIYLRQLKNH
jgi:hypothetical protein